MQPYTYFIIFQEKNSKKNLPQSPFPDLGRFRPGPFGRSASHSWAAGPKPEPGLGNRRPSPHPAGPWRLRRTCTIGSLSDGQCRSHGALKRRVVGAPGNPSALLSLLSLSPHPWRRPYEAEERRRRKHSPA